MKFECTECGNRCTLDCDGGAIRTYPKCIYKTNWHEVKPESDVRTSRYGGAAGEGKPTMPEFEQTWCRSETDNPETITFVHVECPGCKEKDGEIKRLQKSYGEREEDHRSFIEMHNAMMTSRDRARSQLEAEIARLKNNMAVLQKESADWERTAGEMSDRSSRQFGEIEELKKSRDDYAEAWGQSRATAHEEKTDKILALLEQWEPAKKGGE